MEKIPYDIILNIQRKVNIVDVIAEYLPLEQKGKNYFAICPFHDDHNPSMSISPEKQIYTCFVCGASGNVFNFVMNYEKVSFTKAVLMVAEKAGVNLNLKAENSEKKIDSSLEKYYKIFEIVNKFYQNNIKTTYGKKAVEYLNRRNLDDAVIKEFQIGLSFDDNSASKLLTSKGYSNEDLEKIGLCGVKDNFCYDIFRNRIMFPLSDLEGHVIGYSGRIYNGENDNKYVNSKESIIFKKGLLLYNYHRALKYAREKHQIIVVEGFMDVIRLYTIGIKNVVATMGTAITKEHADLIKKLSKNVVLCFDGDNAGQKATISALEALNKIGLDPKIIRLEENYDPDDYVINKGENNFLGHLNNPLSSLEFKMDVNKKNINFNDFVEISKYVNEMSKELEKITDKVVYELTIKKISKETNVDVDTIKALINTNIKEKKIVYEKPKVAIGNKYQKAEEFLVYYMLRSSEAIKLYQDNISYFSNRLLAKIAIQILEFYNKNNYINVTDFTIFLEDKTDLINEVLRIDKLNLPEELKIEQINDYIKTIEEGIVKEEIRNLKLKIKTESDITKKISYLEKLAKLKKECK